MSSDWREPLLAGAALLDVPVARRDPASWPGYLPEPSVRAFVLAGAGAVAAAWDFSVQGGSYGEDDAAVFAAAVDKAVELHVPLVTLVRSGGTRLQEGMAALVGIPRARFALRRLADAHLPHLSVADAPTTGGVWISIASAADLRVAVTGATVGFVGPRVVEAFTGELPGPDSHTAESAWATGRVDEVLSREGALSWLQGALRTWTPDLRAPARPPARHQQTQRGGWAQVLATRDRTISGRDLLHGLLTDPLPLRAPHGDTTVTALVGRLQGRPLVGVAVASELGGRPTPNGFRLAARAYALAGRLDLPVLSLVDTPGADASPRAEKDGIAQAMGEALDALLGCPSPTLALVHGEGGSGGALAAAAADRVLVTDRSYFAPIGPEGATAALRRPREECAELMRITPGDLLRLGFADALAEPSDVPGHLDELVRTGRAERLALRAARWSGPLPGRV
ncbi:MAG: carboxyl transferase domain-containing protein [Mycobacteriales bacterium]